MRIERQASQTLYRPDIMTSGKKVQRLQDPRGPASSAQQEQFWKYTSCTLHRPGSFRQHAP